MNNPSNDGSLERRINMEQPEPLLACPFCGGKPEYDNSDNANGGKWYGCTECGARQWAPEGSNFYEM